jgi:hypothetical protein
MGLSSNQARFLSLTARQIDLEHRMQQICQRRLRLSSEMQRAAQAYNDQTSDRRLFLNNANSYSSAAGGAKGPITHDILTDNNAYELLSAQNLYDNGLHLFRDGKIITFDDSGVANRRTGNSVEFDKSVIGSHNLGDWLNGAGNLCYKITGIPSPLPYNIIPPAVGDTPDSATSHVTSSKVLGPAVNTTTQYTAWVGGSVTQNQVTGFTTATYIRTASYDNNAGTQEMIVPVTQVTNIGTSNATVNIGGVDFHQYTFTDYANRIITRLAIGDIDANQGKAQLQALAAASGVVSNDFILMNDIDLSGQEWGVIDNFAGSFDGNLHKISGIEINSRTSNSGLFGTIEEEGSVKNLNLDEVTISAESGAYEIGSLAGANFGDVNNVHSSNIDIYVEGDLGSSPIYEFRNGNNAIGGLVGGNSGSIDRVSATGLITLDTVDTLDGVGSLIGTNGSTSSLISSTMAAVDIKTDSDLECVNTLVGCDAIAGNYENCYTTSSILYLDGSDRDEVAYQNEFFSGHNVGSNVTNCYKLLNDGSYAYWNGEGTANNSIDNSDSYNNTSGQWSTPNVNGTPIWNATGSSYPSLNFAALNNEKGDFDVHTTTSWTETKIVTDNPGTDNIYKADEYEIVNIPLDDLDKALRSGEIQLARHADAMTQNPVVVDDESYELVDWRTQPIISDDLYEENDAEAQTLYEKTIRDVNAQDKQLELEQNNVETEYKAITSEKESVNKILDTNIKASFKYFG